MKIAIVGGVIANKLQVGGAVWTRLNWILGLKKLGFDVYFVEQIDRRSCVDSQGAIASFEESENLKYFRAVTHQWGLDGRATLIYEDGQKTVGLSQAELIDLAADAALLVNITGHLQLENLKDLMRCKVYVDLDPGFTQFWQASGHLGSHFRNHDYYFTVGENIGKPSCSIPTDGIPWRATRQPVVLEEWPRSQAGDRTRFTTIAAWRGPYGSVETGSKRLGLKVHEFRKLLELPQKVDAAFELALDIHDDDSKDRQALEDHGWNIVNPRQAVPDPSSFRRYVQESGAEFSVAKEIYVETNSGWFSDRTVRYLASGKPALVQETGLSTQYPVGEGLLTFRNLDEAVEGSRRILTDYERHCDAARHIAEEYFDSQKVLGELTEAVGVSA
jgi:hypothetical protein